MGLRLPLERVASRVAGLLVVASVPEPSDLGGGLRDQRHSREIQQQLRETFKLEQALKFRSIPDAMLKLEKNEYHGKTGQVGPEAIAAIKLNAQWIEDADLQAALLSLAESLEEG